MWVDKDGIETPDGFDDDDLDVIAGKAQSQYWDEQRRIWGTCNDKTIGRDIVRHVLLVVEQHKKVTPQHSLHMAAVGVLLLPCPFCGGDPVRHRVLRDGYEDFRDDPDAWAHYVVCRSCAAQGGWAKSVSGAARWWNMRMPRGLPRPAGRIDGLLACTVCFAILPVNEMYSVDACSEKCQSEINAASG